MSRHITREVMADHGVIVDAPRVPLAMPVADRSFELPKGLYMATAACYLAFLAILATALKSPGLIIPMGICVILLAGYFGVPALWTRMAPASRTEPMDWSQFRRRGIVTHTGHLSSGEAAIQMLILPVLIVFWALAVVVVAALV